MDSSLQHLRLRKDKAFPFGDECKIILVSFGGTMSGVCGASALAVFSKLGYEASFDEIWSYSAGFANAASFLSGRITDGHRIYFVDLANKKFISFLRFWRIINIDYLVSVLKNKVYIDPMRIRERKTKLFVYLRNISLKKYEFLEVHSVNKEDFWTLVKTSMSIPYFDPGSKKIGNFRYKDIGFDDDPVRNFISKVIDSDATDIIFLVNTKNQERIIRSYIASNTLQRFAIIAPQGNAELKPLEINPARVKKASQSMKEKVHELMASTSVQIP